MIECIYVALYTLQSDALHLQLVPKVGTVYVINNHLIRSIATKTMSCHPHLNYDVTGTSVNY
jgi:hypothetical protein